MGSLSHNASLQSSILQGSPDAGSWEASGSSAHVWVPAGSSESNAEQLESLLPAGAACPVQTNPHGSRSASRAWDVPPERPAARVHVPDSRCTSVSHLSWSTSMEKHRRAAQSQNTSRSLLCSPWVKGRRRVCVGGRKRGIVGGGEETHRLHCIRTGGFVAWVTLLVAYCCTATALMMESFSSHYGDTIKECSLQMFALILRDKLYVHGIHTNVKLKP